MGNIKTKTVTIHQMTEDTGTSNETTTPTAEDILGADMTGVNTDFPKLAPGPYTLEVVRVEKKSNVAKTGDNIRITLKTVEEAHDVAGNVIRPNFPITDNISLVETSEYDRSAIQRRLKTFRKACTGENTGAFWPLDQYKGLKVEAVLKVQPAKGEFDERTVIGRYVIPAED